MMSFESGPPHRALKPQARKNGRRISLIRHATAVPYTLGTPKKPLCPGRCNRHDA